MTTVSEVIREANDLLLSGGMERSIQVSEALDTIETSIEITPETPLTVGDRIQVDHELLYVAEVNSGMTLTVLRGFLGTTPATHVINSWAVINPAVPDYQWLRHFNNELRSLSSPVAGLFNVQAVEVTYSARSGYNIPDFVPTDQVMAIYAKQPGGRFDHIPMNRRDWSIQENMDTDEFASGYALRVTGTVPYPGHPLRMVTRGAFTLLTDYSSTIESTGLPDTAIDLLAIGAVIRATETNEIARNRLTSQPSRRLADVPPGALNASAAGLRQRYQERRIEERTRLIRRYGL